MESPTSATIYEVGPRDGLQNEPETVPTEAKRELLRRLAGAGLRRIEATSYVSPKWIPQLADADALAAQLPEGPVWSALVPNARGYERFRKSGMSVAAFFVSASETHNRRNVNASIAEHIGAFAPVAARIREDGVRLRAYVSTVCGCPYEGDVALTAVLDVVRRLVGLGVEEISLGDTIGVGTPAQVRELVRTVADEVSLERVALHLHDTYGRALANAMAGYAEGIRTFDSSLGGLGGCPYAPGASGNVATEDLVDLFDREGIESGVDLEALVDACAWLEDDVLRRPLVGRVYRARRGVRERERMA